MGMTTQADTAWQQLQAVRDVIAVKPRSYFTWFGMRWSPPSARQGYADVERGGPLSIGLQRQLYENFYCVGYPRPGDASALGQLSSSARDVGFLNELIRSNDGRGPWQAGWRRESRIGEDVLVSRGGLSLVVPRSRIRERTRAGGNDQALTDEVQIRLPHDSLGISPGYYLAIGNLDFFDRPSITVARLYWNSTSVMAPVLLRLLTRNLNSAEVPFRLKALKEPGAYTRCDAVVLYLEKPDLPALWPMLQDVYRQVRSGLRPDVPALTKNLSPGLGAADDPGLDESFGMHRCKILAQAFVEAAEEKCTPDGTMGVIAAAFRTADLDIAKPYLGPHEADVYDGLQPPLRLVGPELSRKPSGGTNHALHPFDVAHLIADWLADSAIWYDDRCNWVGGSPVELPESSDTEALSNGSLDSTLYLGTSGIALFLGELSLLSDRPLPIRATALGALRQALASAESDESRDLCGLYDGNIGVAVVACYLGRAFGDSSVLGRGRALLQRIVGSTPQNSESDLISGLAGDIHGLLILGGMFGEAGWIEAATRLAEILLALAHRDAAGLSWPTPNMVGTQIGLTGFSHGAAGIGMVLAELGMTTQTERFLVAARDAFAYERHYFSPERSNWADLRWQNGKHFDPRWAGYAPYWCHGAAGIALSRLRTGAVTGTTTYLTEAEHALRSTVRWIQQTPAQGWESIAMCHGVLGNIEVLRLADRYLAQGMSRYEDIVSHGEQEIRLLFSRDPSHWPCKGAGRIMVPGLLCGLAGVGHFYLRSYAPEIPSVLLLEPEHFTGNDRATRA